MESLLTLLTLFKFSCSLQYSSFDWKTFWWFDNICTASSHNFVNIHTLEVMYNWRTYLDYLTTNCKNFRNHRSYQHWAIFFKFFETFQHWTILFQSSKRIFKVCKDIGWGFLLLLLKGHYPDWRNAQIVQWGSM